MRRRGGRGNLLRCVLSAHHFVVVLPQITRRVRRGKESQRDQSGIYRVLEVAQLFAYRYTQCSIVGSYRRINLGLEKRSCVSLKY